MSAPSGDPTLFRIIRGRPTEEELAALAALLRARPAEHAGRQPAAAAGPHPPHPRWMRRERRTSYAPAHSWQTVA